jgi:hypothetical protein
VAPERVLAGADEASEAVPDADPSVIADDVAAVPGPVAGSREKTAKRRTKKKTRKKARKKTKKGTKPKKARKTAKKKTKKKTTKKLKKRARTKARRSAAADNSVPAQPPHAAEAAQAEPAKEAVAQETAPDGPQDAPRPEPDAVGPVELSAEEAVALLAELRSSQPADEPASGPWDSGAEAEFVIEPSRPALAPVSFATAACRVIAFEQARVEPELRVATTAVAHLYAMARAGELDIELGGICEGADEFFAEWDAAPPGLPVAVIANLDGAGGFLDRVVAERPAVGGAYWIVFETLRGEVTSSTSEFLADRKAANRVRAIGYGPRNVIEAARRGAEALRGHVEWGFGRARIRAAG